MSVGLTEAELSQRKYSESVLVDNGDLGALESLIWEYQERHNK